jgi:hypothetical protein
VLGPKARIAPFTVPLRTVILHCKEKVHGDGYRNIGMYFLRSFSAHHVRTENRYIITTFATLDRAHIGTRISTKTGPYCHRLVQTDLRGARLLPVGARSA